MKKISNVYEKNMNEQDVIFVSPVEAKRYAKLVSWANYDIESNIKGQFAIKEAQLYSSVKDYANENQDEYVLKLVKARKNIQEYIDAVNEGKIFYKAQINQYFFVANLPKLKSIKLGDEIKLINVNDNKDTVTQEITENLYPYIRANINKVNDKIEGLTVLSEQYKEELNSFLEQEELAE